MFRPHKFAIIFNHLRRVSLTSHAIGPIALQSTRYLHQSSNCSFIFNKEKKQDKSIKYTIDSITPESSLDDMIVLLKYLTRYTPITIASKKRKLKSLIFEIIEKSPDGFIMNEHLKSINDALNFILDNLQETDFIGKRETITILKACIKNLTLDQVHDLNFIPRLYSKITQLNPGRGQRLELFEIFINYISLSNNRYQFGRLVDAFIEQEPELASRAILISLDALQKSLLPDTKSLLKLSEYYKFQYKETNQQLIELFVTACEIEISQGSQDLHSNISQMVALISDKKKKKLLYPILEFCSNNDIDDLALEILLEFTKLQSIPSELSDDLMMICLKYQDPSQICQRILQENTTIANLEWALYNEQDFGNFIKEQDLFTKADVNIDLYNKLLQICIYSKKSKFFIDEFDEYFQNEYLIGKNALSYAILIENSILTGEIEEGLLIFEKSVQDDFIDWGKEEDARYLPVVFKLFAMYTKHEKELVNVHDFYNKVKNFGHNLDEESLSNYFTRLIDGLYIGDALTLLSKELSDERNHGHVEIYNKLIEFITTYKDDSDVNYECYLKLDQFFVIRYDDYKPILEIFCCHYKKPQLAYKIFTNMRNHAKQNIIEPPNEKIYEFLFQEFGQLLYEDGIFKLHLLLKVDMNVNLDIDLLNSVLESFTNVQELLKARDTFEIVLALPRERGLNSRTVSIMLKCFTFTTVQHMKSFWNNLSSIDYFPTRLNYKQYLIGHCYHDRFEELINLVETWDKHNEVEIDADFLTILYNWTPSLEGKQCVAEFGESKYASIWSQLENEGKLIKEEDQLPSLVEAGRDELLQLN